MKSIGYRLSNFDENFNNYKIISSPMIRTRHSSQIIAEILNITDTQIIEEDLINEIDVGDLTNIKKTIIAEKYPNLEKEKEKDLLNFRSPNGESNHEVFLRVKEFCNKYKEEKNLIIVTHGVCVQFITHILENKDKTEFTKGKTDQNYFFSWDRNNVKKI